MGEDVVAGEVTAIGGEQVARGVERADVAVQDLSTVLRQRGADHAPTCPIVGGVVADPDHRRRRPPLTLGQRGLRLQRRLQVMNCVGDVVAEPVDRCRETGYMP
jgi:hypothetical protein